MLYTIKISRIKLIVFIFAVCTVSLHAADLDKIRQRMNHSLRHKILDTWYPFCLDTANGGFFSEFSSDWKKGQRQDKFLVNQARHIWTLSTAAAFYKDSVFMEMAEHGFTFLKNHMRDNQYGGFFMLRSRSGEGIQYSYRDEKRAYGLAFAIYALTAYYQISGDKEALCLAVDTFHWLEYHSHDPEFGGYMDQMTRNGDWLCRHREESEAWDLKASEWKDQNSSIHLLEAFTELYKIWPDSLLRCRLTEMFLLIRDTITDDSGSLRLFFQRDWQPVSFRDSTEAVRSANYFYDHISFGHNVETAYLLIEAMRVLNPSDHEKTEQIAKKMVDYALLNGWNNKYGGFFDAGYALKNPDSVSIINQEKVWWVQAEGLNALLLMHSLFPDQSIYMRRFLQQWQYIDQYLIDHKHGGWYASGLDQNPEQTRAPKATLWKATYHNTRAMINCLRRLSSNPSTE